VHHPCGTLSGPRIIVELASYGIVSSTVQALAPGCYSRPEECLHLHDHAHATAITCTSPYKLGVQVRSRSRVEAGLEGRRLL
jgi:hypothetical protein